MNVARLNFSHGEFAAHQQNILNLRAAAQATGRPLAIMADLSGPKMRIGRLTAEPIQLKHGDVFTLTTDDIVGDQQRVSVSFARLPKVVKPGDKLSLNDGYIQLEVVEVRGPDVVCKVTVGGELRSRKGLNLPGIDLGVSAFTDRDRECLQFALAQGVDAVSRSFVEGAADVEAFARRPRRWPSAISHREDRTQARVGTHRRNPRRRRRDHDCARGSGRGSAHRTNRGHPKGPYSPGQSPGEAGDHGHADAGVHDPQLSANSRRGHRRFQCRPRWHRWRDVVRGIRLGDFPVESVAMLSRIAATVEATGAERRSRRCMRTSISRARSCLCT